MADHYLTGVNSSVAVSSYLISRPRVGTGIFSRSVVAIVNRNSAGTTGFILSHRTEFTVNDLAVAAGIGATSTGAGIPLYRGGPVNSNTVYLLHTTDYFTPQTEITGGFFNYTSDKSTVETLLSGVTPRIFRVLLGYSAWAPGQLEREIQERRWIECDLPVDVVFDTDSHDLYDRSVAAAAEQVFTRWF